MIFRCSLAISRQSMMRTCISFHMCRKRLSDLDDVNAEGAWNRAKADPPIEMEAPCDLLVFGGLTDSSGSSLSY